MTILDKIRHSFYWVIIKISRSNSVTRFLVDVAALSYYKLFRSHKYFVFRGKKYKYFYHRYNRTIAGERVVEIPIVVDFLQKHKTKNILEIGNVLSHYFPVNHDILDKYEVASGIINQDVATFKFKKKYGLILSISTMEHVGFNYGEKSEPRKFLKAISNLKRHLNKGGLMIITLPIYFNPNVSKLIINKKMPFTKEYFLKRVSYLNEWKEVKYSEALSGMVYDGHFANSNVLYIGMLRN